MNLCGDSEIEIVRTKPLLYQQKCRILTEELEYH